MALPKTDNFTVGSDTLLTDYSASWKVNNSSAWTVNAASDAVACTTQGTDGEGACHWEGDSFNNNQYAQGKIVATGNPIGAAVRVASGTTGTYYGFYADGGSHYLFKYSGGWTQIGDTDATDGAVNEVIRLEVSGTNLSPKINGALWGQGVKSDDAIASGYAGLSVYGYGATLIDDFEGGNLDTEPSISVSDSIGVTDTPTMGGVPNISVTDSVQVTDNPTLGGVPNISVTDSVGLIDTPTVQLEAPGEYSVSVIDSITVSDVPSVEIEGEAPIALSINICPENNWIVGVMIYTP